VLVESVVLFGVASLASAFSPDVHFLTVIRFLTGIGLGGAMPSSIKTSWSWISPGRTNNQRSNKGLHHVKQSLLYPLYGYKYHYM
jgi:MFS family permease